MMSITRFRALAGRYGANPALWPAAERTAAGTLLHGDFAAEADRILATERPLDAALRAAFKADAEQSWEHGEQDAALERMRADIARRIDTAPASASHLHIRWWRQAGRSAGGTIQGAAVSGARAGGRRWIGLAAGGGLVMASGLCIGLMLPMTTPRAPTDLFGMLQAVPIEIGR